MEHCQFPCGCNYLKDWLDEPGMHSLGLCAKHARRLLGVNAQISYTVPCEQDLDELCARLKVLLAKEADERRVRMEHPRGGMVMEDPVRAGGS